MELSPQVKLVKYITDNFLLDDQSLLNIIKSFRRQLAQAQHSNKSDSFDLYPTFVTRLPNGTEKGKYIALDLGGTNFRILLVILQPNRPCSVINQTFALSQELMQGSGPDLFDYIGQCLYKFAQTQNLLNVKISLGFTFSFPCQQSNLKSAILVNWTKGFCCSNTVGKDVCLLLEDSLRKYPNLLVEVVAVLNDTTGTLVSCAYDEPDCCLGVIIGTGVNACYLAETGSDKQCSMVMNTELGSFGSRDGCLDFLRTAWDRQIDQNSINPGKQQFEKMISGMYMGSIVQMVMKSLIEKRVVLSSVTTSQSESICCGTFFEPNSFSTSYISLVEKDLFDSTSFENTRSVFRSMGIDDVSLDDCRSLHLVCSRVSSRAAHLVSATTAALMAEMGRDRVVVALDGSVYRHHPRFRYLMKDKIAHLLVQLHCPTQFELMLSNDGSGKGAALVAASAVTATTVQGSSKEFSCQRCRKSRCVSLKNSNNLCSVCS